MTAAVIVCDGCGLATPARFRASHGQPAVTEEQRETDLRSKGWYLTPENDLCPNCYTHHAAVADEIMNP